MRLIKGLIPDNNTEFGLAFSGGVDSVVFAHYLKLENKKFKLYFFNHGNDEDKKALAFAEAFSLKYNIDLITNSDVVYIKETEHEWRNARYKWLESFNVPIVTGHNLDDVVSGYLLFWIKGQEKFIPVKRNNIIRPFLLVKKKHIYKYARRFNIDWNEEECNSNLDIPRNRVNLNILPEILKINPGFDKKIEKLFEEKLKREMYL
jgi:tRNA(ile)-lysidine synthase